MRILDESKAQRTFPIAIVAARFNSEVCDRLLEGAIERLKERDFQDEQITVVRVPGAVEIALACRALMKSGSIRAVVALGAVIRGETDHYDYVCTQVSQGCQTVMLETGIPIAFGVLTTDNDAQALDRCGGAHGHKGRDAVDVAVEMVSLLEKIGSP